MTTRECLFFAGGVFLGATYMYTAASYYMDKMRRELNRWRKNG